MSPQEIYNRACVIEPGQKEKMTLDEPMNQSAIEKINEMVNQDRDDDTTVMIQRAGPNALVVEAFLK